MGFDENMSLFFLGAIFGGGNVAGGGGKTVVSVKTSDERSAPSSFWLFLLPKKKKFQPIFSLDVDEPDPHVSWTLLSTRCHTHKSPEMPLDQLFSPATAFSHQPTPSTSQISESFE